MVDTFVYWAIAIATIAGVAFVVLAIFQWSRARRPERLRIGERLPKAIAKAADLPHAREIHREYCVTLLKKNAVSNIMLGMAILLASFLAFMILPPFKAALAQISPHNFEILPLFLLSGLATIFVATCSSVGSLLATALLPIQYERRDNPSDHVVDGLSRRVVIVTCAPIVLLLAITLVYVLSPTATHIYLPTITAVKELHSWYPWIPFAIPFALLAGTLISGVCIWSLKRLAPRHMVSEISVSANADWSERQSTILQIFDDWQRLPNFVVLSQILVLGQCFAPAFIDTSLGFNLSLLIYMAPLLLWIVWSMFLAERLQRWSASQTNAAVEARSVQS